MANDLDKKTIIAKITERLLELFSIEDFDTYRNVVSSFDDYFDQLVQNNIVKNTNERTDFFSPVLVNMNYKRLDTVYQKRLIADDLDERFFLKERLTILTHLSPDRDITVKHLP
jgi:transcription termination factor NusB